MIRFTEPVQKASPSRYAIMTATERAIRRAILDAIAKVQQSTSTREIVAALDAGDVNRAVALVRLDLGEDFLRSALPVHLRGAYETAGLAATAETGRQLGIGYSFNLITPRAIEWVSQNAGSLIQQWGDSSRDALRRLIGDAFQRGIGSSALARQIKQTGIGITWRSARAVLNMRHRLEADGVAADTIDKRAERYFNRLLRDRAEMIARTEMTRAMTHARLESWRQAIGRGLLDPGRYVKEWVTTHDARTCETCLALDGARAPVPDGIFIGEDGTNGGLGPGAHPRCRCIVITVEAGSQRIPRAQPNIPGDPGIRPRRAA
jgi:SPP1 gp7 family putative phage head morphogenesis protein